MADPLKMNNVRQKISIQLFDGRLVNCNIFVSPGSHGISDILNDSRGFIPVDLDGELHFFNKSHIVNVILE